MAALRASHGRRKPRKRWWTASRAAAWRGRGSASVAKFTCHPGQATAGSASREPWIRSEEHTSEIQSLMRISYAVFCLKKNKITQLIRYTKNSRLQNTFKHTIQNF